MFISLSSKLIKYKSVQVISAVYLRDCAISKFPSAMKLSRSRAKMRFRTSLACPSSMYQYKDYIECARDYRELSRLGGLTAPSRVRAIAFRDGSEHLVLACPRTDSIDGTRIFEVSVRARANSYERSEKVRTTTSTRARRCKSSQRSRGHGSARAIREQQRGRRLLEADEFLLFGRDRRLRKLLQVSVTSFVITQSCKVGGDSRRFFNSFRLLILRLLI